MQHRGRHRLPTRDGRHMTLADLNGLPNSRMLGGARSALLLREKADQAQALLTETGLDLLAHFRPRDRPAPRPSLEQVVGASAVRNSAFLFGFGGQRIAIVANFDASSIRAQGVFAEVIGHDEDFRDPLLAALRRLDPRRIRLNDSLNDVTADGLTHGY